MEYNFVLHRLTQHTQELGHVTSRSCSIWLRVHRAHRLATNLFLRNQGQSVHSHEQVITFLLVMARNSMQYNFVQLHKMKYRMLTPGLQFRHEEKDRTFGRQVGHCHQQVLLQDIGVPAIFRKFRSSLKA